MRYLVYLLILVNLALFSWQWLASETEKEVRYSLATPPGIDRLILLSERGKASATSVNSPDTPVADAQSPSPEIIAKVVPPPAGDSVEVARRNAVKEQVCQTVGPFLDKEDVTQVYALLARNGYVVNIRDGDVREPDGYWVYLPAMPAGRARKIVADLDAHGMTDYFIGKQNHISLGIFSDGDKARMRQRIVKKLGYDAMLGPRYRMRDVFWLDAEHREKALLESDIWQQIQAEHSDIRVQRLSCE